MGGDGKDKRHSEKTISTTPKNVRRSGLSRPLVMLSNYLNELLMPVVTGHHSIDMVANFQRMCGLTAEGKANNLFLDSYFRLASTCGEEIFLLMPLLFWCALPVAVPFLTNFLIMQICGQLTKDFFRLPRPVSPKDSTNPIIKLDKTFETEYGLPSTHTIAGLLPLTTMLILLRHGVEIGSRAWSVGVVYWISVALSRLYLGVHSVYDLLAGAILGVTVMSLLHVYGDALDVVLYQYSGALYVQLALLAVYFVFYPRAGPWSASMGTAAQMVGPFFGCGISLWYILNINHSLRDTLLTYSMVNPRPYLTQSITTLYNVASSSISDSAGSVVSGGAGGIANISSAYELGIVLSTASKQLFSASAYDWQTFCVSMQSTSNNSVVAAVPSVAYTWFNTHADSFNAISYKLVFYRIAVASVISGAAKVVFKIIPNVLFSALYKYKIIRDSEMHRLDCFDRVVPPNKAYCVEVPVRVINYALIGVMTVLAAPYVWQRMPPLEA